MHSKDKDKTGLLLKRLARFSKKSEGHRLRVKERFIKDGPETFTDEDLLELLLFFGIPRKDTRGLARELLKAFGGRLDHVLDAPPEELFKIPGLGPNSILPLKVVHEVARRYLRSKSTSEVFFNSPKEVFDYLLYELKGEKREIFMVLYLANNNRVLSIERLSEGTITESAIYPREIFGRAYSLGASKLVLVHNHPSGNLTPSREDIRITKLIALAGHLLNMRVIDHLIIGENGYMSFAEQGLMDQIERELKRDL